ncbi:NAD-dependent epimerase/dehydratase family protein [Desulfosediminicola sp.]|uniref:NAD-dependent epimerase/dehydratase family protein n=1 Tax=Desulfosediminicola sp. TaxID=2886825 RepID=UPI003AF2C60D
MKVLITGGAGFIGANLIRKLINKHEVIVYDNLCRGNSNYIPKGVSLIEGDIRNTEKLGKVALGVEVVVHLAAFGSVVESVSDPVTNFEINAAGTLSALEASRNAKVKKFIFASTGGALMGSTSPPVNETSLPKPISPYGVSKLCGEAYCNAYAASYGLTSVCLRFANIYGPYSGHKKGVVTEYIKRAHSNKPLIVYGDGSSSRDYLHVSDLCDGIQAAIENNFYQNDIFHLGSGKETTIVKLAKTINGIANRKEYNIKFLNARAGEVERNYASYSKANRILRFTPQIDLQKGLENTYKWFLDNELST